MSRFYFLLEIVAILLYIVKFGIINYFAEVIVSAIFGIFIIFKFGFIQIAPDIKKFSINPLDTFSTSFGGFLLIMPGILTDICGIFIIIFTLLFGNKEKDDTKEFFYKKQKQDKFNSRFDYFNEYKKEDKKNKNDVEIIDVEVIEEDK